MGKAADVLDHSMPGLDILRRHQPTPLAIVSHRMRLAMFAYG